MIPPTVNANSMGAEGVDDRLRALDEANSRSIEFFDLLESFDKALSLPRAQDPTPETLLRILRHHVRWLIPFDVTGFWIPDPESHEFTSCDVVPETGSSQLSAIVEPLLDSGTFGWALRQNRPVLLHPAPNHPACLLHSLATPNRKIGMFSGLFLSGSFHEHDPHWRMLSVLLQRGAQAIESLELNRQIRHHNQQLELLVAERTSALQSALLSAQEAETMFKGIFNESPDVILVLDPSSHEILAANPAVQSLLEHNKNTLIGESFDLLIPNDSIEKSSILFSPIDRHDIAKVSLPLVRRTGSLCRMDLTASLLPWREGKGILVTLRDTTLREAIEQERLKVSKLESLGDLAGSIAHNFNNLLMAISGNLELVQMEKSPEKQADYFKKISDSCDQAREVSGRLLTFARGGAPVCAPISIEPLIDQVVSRLSTDNNIKIERLIPPTISPVQADFIQLSQAITQILLNAIESMPKGGKILITTSQEGEFIKCRIEDTGCGIPADNLPRIIDPYVSTKAGRQGLGLTIANSIIENHRGSLSIQSTLGIGTQVKFLIPVGKNSPTIEKQATLEKESLKILYMDDESTLRALMQNILTREKHHIVCTEEGEKTIDVFSKAIAANEPFDLVLLDLTIAGGMGGVETIKALKKIDPHVKAIACSGYSTESVMSDHGHHGFLTAIPKPFKIDQLLSTLKKLARE